MNGIIYYFSGRGNSLRVARDLSNRLDSMKIRSMGKTTNETLDMNVDCIGIITPVIDFGIPAYVERFIKNLKVQGDHPYVFSVITFGGMPCASISKLEKCINRKGLEMSAGFMIRFGLEQYSESDWNTLLDEMASVIRSKTIRTIGGISIKDKLFTALLNPLAKRMIPGEDKKFKVNKACNACGVCARVCPAGNISIEGSKPVWGHKCEQCAACFAWCPAEAVYGTNLAAKTRYRNPHVTLNQILKS